MTLFFIKAQWDVPQRRNVHELDSSKDGEVLVKHQGELRVMAPTERLAVAGAVAEFKLLNLEVLEVVAVPIHLRVEFATTFWNHPAGNPL